MRHFGKYHVWAKNNISPDTSTISPALLYACGNTSLVADNSSPSELPDKFDYVGASNFSSRIRNLSKMLTLRLRQSKVEPKAEPKTEPKSEPKQTAE